MARIDVLKARLTALKDLKRRVSDSNAKERIDAAIARTERQIGGQAARMGRAPRRSGGTRQSSGRFG